MPYNYVNVFFSMESTVFLLTFVVDCGLVTRSRESCYRSSEYLMHLWDEHKAWPQYRWRVWERREHLIFFLFCPPSADKCFKFLFVFHSQLELCGGLTPILERSTQASCDDTENCTNIGLLEETEKLNTNYYHSEENSTINYTPMVCF